MTVEEVRGSLDLTDNGAIKNSIQEEDSAEVNEMVRTAKVTPEQLAALLRQSATTTPNPAALSAVGATFEKEVDADED